MTMLLVYARQSIPDLPSIFLAGPTPRNAGVKSWRGAAVKFLSDQRFSGAVLIPEPSDGVWLGDYDGQIDWETAALERATCILFWIPREMTSMPGLTTNDEWGFWKASGKVVLGAPPEAVSVRYQRRYAERHGIPCLSTLPETVCAAITMVDGLHHSQT